MYKNKIFVHPGETDHSWSNNWSTIQYDAALGDHVVYLNLLAGNNKNRLSAIKDEGQIVDPPESFVNFDSYTEWLLKHNIKPSHKEFHFYFKSLIPKIEYKIVRNLSYSWRALPGGFYIVGKDYWNRIQQKERTSYRQEVIRYVGIRTWQKWGNPLLTLEDNEIYHYLCTIPNLLPQDLEYLGLEEW